MVEKRQRRAGDGVGVGVMKKKIRIRDEIVVDLVISRAIRAAKKVGDSNSESPFVWRKKLERELADGVFSLEDLRMLSSAKAQKRRHKHRLVEVKQLKKREESLVKRVQRQEVAEWCNNSNKNKNLQDEEEDADCSSSTLTTNSRFDDDSHNSSFFIHHDHDDDASSTQQHPPIPQLPDIFLHFQQPFSSPLIKPQFFNTVHTAFQWNRYNRTHYDHQNPPPKSVVGYKFKVFYPHLPHNANTPHYFIHQDFSSPSTNAIPDTCLITFHAGPPYQDIHFRIVNNDWDYSPKSGFKSTFESGVLHLYFYFKRRPHRR